MVSPCVHSASAVQCRESYIVSYELNNVTEAGKNQAVVLALAEHSS